LTFEILRKSGPGTIRNRRGFDKGGKSDLAFATGEWEKRENPWEKSLWEYLI